MCLGDKRKNTKKGLFFQDIAKKFIFLNINPTFVKFGAADSSPPSLPIWNVQSQQTFRQIGSINHAGWVMNGLIFVQKS